MLILLNIIIIISLLYNYGLGNLIIYCKLRPIKEIFV